VLKNLVLVLVSFVFVTGCSKKKKNTSVIDTIAIDGGTATDVETKPLSYDAMGSDSGNISGLSSINFGYDQFSLSSESRARLASNAEWMKSNPGASVQIEGHCDSRGSIEYNLTLGERRANAVKSHLIGLGVDGGRLSTISYGEEKPMAGGDSESDHNMNRRANFVPIQ